MSNLTCTTPIDTFMQSSNQAGMQAALALGTAATQPSSAFDAAGAAAAAQSAAIASSLQKTANLGDVQSVATSRSNLGVKSAGTLDFSTDGTLAGDSDILIATQKAVKTYVDSQSLPISGGTLEGTLRINNDNPINVFASDGTSHIAQLGNQGWQANSFNAPIFAFHVSIGSGDGLPKGVRMSNDALVGWSSDAVFFDAFDVVLSRDSPGVMAHRNGSNPQAIIINESYTDGSNFSGIKIDTSTGVAAFVIDESGSGIGALNGFQFSQPIELSRINFGGTSNVNAALQQDVGGMNVMLGDDSGFGFINASNIASKDTGWIANEGSGDKTAVVGNFASLDFSGSDTISIMALQSFWNQFGTVVNKLQALEAALSSSPPLLPNA